MAFDVFEFAAGATHPEGQVTIYMDNATAYKARKLDEKLNSSHKFNLTDAQLKKMERELKALKKKIEESKVVITLQGIPVRERAKLQERAKEEVPEESPEQSRRLDALMFAAHYRSAENAAGEKDDTEWTVEKAEKFLQVIPEEAHNRIIEAIVDLSWRSDNFEQVETSASFS